VAAYYVDEAQGSADADDVALRAIAYDANLGLAVEGMPREVTTETLWRVM
jgi:hypothetical protein